VVRDQSGAKRCFLIPDFLIPDFLIPESYLPIALSRKRTVRAQPMAALSALKLARSSQQKPCWAPA
jgi:hypothetical protein